MRVGEILGLQLNDFKDKYIHIQRTRTRGTIGHGKTNNAIRKISYPSFILDEVKKTHPKDSVFLFGTKDDASFLRSQWSHVCKKAGVEKYRLYSTRHTLVTLEHYASVIESKKKKYLKPYK